MDLNRKMAADILIANGAILVVIGWGGRSVGGVGEIFAYLMMGAGIILGGLGLVIYVRRN